MKTIKSITKNNETTKLVSTNGIYVVLVNDNVVANSIEFNYINSVFEKWAEEIING